MHVTFECLNSFVVIYESWGIFADTVVRQWFYCARRRRVGVQEKKMVCVFRYRF